MADDGVQGSVSDDKSFCAAKRKWQIENGGERFPSVHAYDHGAKPRGDYCFWCGRHRSDPTLSRRPDAEGISEDDWWNDAIEFGVKWEP